MGCDQASLAARSGVPSPTQPASAWTPAEQVARSGLLSEALVLVPCSVSCFLQLSVPEPRALGGLSAALPASGSHGTQEPHSQQQSTTPTAAAPVRGNSLSSPAPPSPPQRVGARPRSWTTAVPSAWTAGRRPAT